MPDTKLAQLDLTRAEILAYRRRVNELDERLPAGPQSLRRAAWAGLQDSMPRAALLSIHARVAATAPDILDDPSLVQVWGPRFSVYVVAAQDAAIFTVGRLPTDEKRRREFEDLADRLEAVLAGRRLPFGEPGRALGMQPNGLRYATTTGRVMLRWDGARQPTIWAVPAPDIDPADARRELVRRYLHVFGPATGASFGEWAGIRPARALATFESVVGEMTPVRTPIGDAWILATDEAAFRERARPSESARLLPSGDAFYLLQGADRELLVPDAARRLELWTSRVWPGALLVGGEIVGVWRRAATKVTIEPWRRLAAVERQAVEREAALLPLPGIDGPIEVRWEAPAA